MEKGDNDLRMNKKDLIQQLSKRLYDKEHSRKKMEKEFTFSDTIEFHTSIRCFTGYRQRMSCQ